MHVNVEVCFIGTVQLHVNSMVTFTYIKLPYEAGLCLALVYKGVVICEPTPRPRNNIDVQN